MAGKVLVVEDSRTQAEQIKYALESLGLEVINAYDGLEGLRLASEMQPSLIVLDIVLPNMDGFQVCHRLRRDPATKAIPIIMLTEKSNPQAIISGVQAGANDYIPKDVFASEHLISTMESLGIL
jgi:CheY-like chemotaxis protein